MAKIYRLNRSWKAVVLGAALLLPSCSLRAVLVNPDPGVDHAASAGAGDGWNYVGQVTSIYGSASGVYLGNYGGGYWVITANHVNGGTFTINGTPYSMVEGSGTQIGGADLYVFRIDVPEGDSSFSSLTNLNLATSPVANGTMVTMIGYGRNREALPSTWYVDVDTNPYSWSETPGGGADATVSGYKWQASDGVKRWGTNVITDSGTTSNIHGTSEQVIAAYSNANGDSVVTVGDSGGGMFTGSGASLTLVGVLNLAGTYSGQGEYSVFGNSTYAVDISEYRDEILDAVPEPRTYALLGLGFLSLVLLYRRQNRAS